MSSILVVDLVLVSETTYVYILMRFSCWWRWWHRLCMSHWWAWTGRRWRNSLVFLGNTRVSRTSLQMIETKPNLFSSVMTSNTKTAIVCSYKLSKVYSEVTEMQLLNSKCIVNIFNDVERICSQN